jgi:pyrimidine oxygenase
MAGLAEATEHIRIFATMHTMTFHPAVAAKLTATIDQICGGRFGINLVAGSNPIDHGQMGIYRGLEHSQLYDVAGEWITVAKRLWSEDRVDFEGEYYRLVDCMSNPKPIQQHPPILCAAVSDRGLTFTMKHATASLVNGIDNEDLKRNGRRAKELAAELGETTKTVGLVMVIPGETDAEARARVDHYNAGVDLEALANREFEYSQGARQWGKDEQADRDARRRFSPSGEPIAVSRSHIAGSVDTLVDELEDIVVGGEFDWFCLYLSDFLPDLEIFGREILPRLVARGVAKPPGTFSPL